MSFYASDSAVALAQDILLKCGKLYVKKYEHEGVGVVGTPGAACVITLTGTFIVDYFNTMTLFIKDDNSKLCYVTIDATVADTSITVDTTASKLVSDDTTAGTFTAATSYNLYILGKEEFFGYSSQSLDSEEEVVEFLDCNEKIRDDVIKVVLGFSGDCKNFSTEKTFSNIFNLTLYGGQTGQKQYHGGLTPPVKSFYQAICKTENVQDESIQIALFKGQFFSNGAVDLSSPGEYKIIPYSFKAVKDALRDSGAVNAWSITESTS